MSSTANIPLQYSPASVPPVPVLNVTALTKPPVREKVMFLLVHLLAFLSPSSHPPTLWSALYRRGGGRGWGYLFAAISQGQWSQGELACWQCCQTGLSKQRYPETLHSAGPVPGEQVPDTH